MAVFLRREPEWNQDGPGGRSGGEKNGASSTGGTEGGTLENAEGVIEGVSPEHAVQQTYPEVITSLDEIHEVGTLAQVCCLV